VFILLQVTQAAIKRVKEELQEMKVDTKEPYIRLFMALG